MDAASAHKAGFSITGGKGFHVRFENGWTISVQFGPGNYCGNYNMDIMSFYEGPKRGKLPASSTAEIAYWGPDGAMQEFTDGGEYPDTVKGYVTPAMVLALMVDIASRSAATAPTVPPAKET